MNAHDNAPTLPAIDGAINAANGRLAVVAPKPEVCDLVQTETLAERVLTPEAQAERDDFQAEYGYDGSCSCRSHIFPPCSFCTHTGNPRNQERDEAAWMTASVS